MNAAWTSNPTVKASVDLGAWPDSDPHYINLSEDGRYLSVGLTSYEEGKPFMVLSVPGLVASHGNVGHAALKTYSSIAGCKAGAVSEKWGVSVVGRGTADGRVYPVIDLQNGETGSVTLPIGSDGLDFDADGALYANNYAEGARGEIRRYVFSALGATASSLASTKTANGAFTGLSRIRNLSVYSIGGRTLLFCGEGDATAASKGKVVVIDVTTDDWRKYDLVTTGLDGDIMNVKVAGICYGIPRLYVATGSGELAIYKLKPEGLSVDGGVQKTLDPATVNTLCGTTGKTEGFRSFEVADDERTAYFVMGQKYSGQDRTVLKVIRNANVTDPDATTVGLWSFDGKVGDTIAAGAEFKNQVDGSKCPARIVARNSGETGHLSSFSAFLGSPANAVRHRKFGTDYRCDSALHIDGSGSAYAGHPISIEDTDGALDLQTFTIEFFVKKTNATATGWEMIFSQFYHYYGSTGQTGLPYSGLYNGLYQVPEKDWEWRYHYVCKDGNELKYGDLTFGPKNINDGKWHHVVFRVKGAERKAELYIDKVWLAEQFLPGDLAYGYEEGGTVERHPLIFGNVENYAGYSWAGDITQIRISDSALAPISDATMQFGSTKRTGDALMYLPLDGDFAALGWTGEQGVLGGNAPGKVSFSNAVPKPRVVDGRKQLVRKVNAGCASFNGGYVDLKITPFATDLYGAVTIEFFAKADVSVFGHSDWLAFLACRQDARTSDNNRLAFLMQENGASGANVRADTPLTTSNNASTSIPADRYPFDGRWHHFAIVLSNNPEHDWQTLSVYQDYQPVSSTSYSGVFTLTSDHFLRFGQKDKEKSIFLMDEFRISRGALGSLQMLHAESNPGLCIIIR